MMIKGKELLINALQAEGVETLFAYPGGFVTGIFDELYRQNSIRVVLPRHEQALVHAADGYARATGKTGVALVTSGPGATNAITGIANAYYDSVPLVCFTGQVPTYLLGNDAFQEVDIVGMTRSVTKHSCMVTRREDLGRIIKEAFTIASTGRPGPVVVDLPTDIMEAPGEGAYPQTVSIRGYQPHPSLPKDKIERAAHLLAAAERPLILAGGGVLLAHAEHTLAALAQRTGIPVVTTIPGKGALPAGHPLYIGNAGMHGRFAANEALGACDLLLAIGTRCSDRVTLNTAAFAPNAAILHIDIDPAAISRSIRVDLSITADAEAALQALLCLSAPLDTASWLEKIAGWQKEHPLTAPPAQGLSPIRILEEVNHAFDDAIFVTDVGQNQMWATQFLTLHPGKRLLTSGGLGTMGFGFPASIGAKLGCPERTVICITGDGGFQMNLQELATAAVEGLTVIVLIFNNGYLGLVRQWQQILFDKHYSATDLTKKEGDGITFCPDFMALADSYGAAGIRITEESQIAPALETAKKQTGAPILLEFLIDREYNVLPMIKSGASLKDMILEVDA